MGNFSLNWIPVPSSLFVRSKKKQFPKFQEALDQEVRHLLENPYSGEPKKGSLKGIRVHKFKFNNQLYLLSYEPVPKTKELFLYTFSVHEKFYERLHRYIR